MPFSHLKVGDNVTLHPSEGGGGYPDSGLEIMASSSKGKGGVKTLEWWKHLRKRKRDQNRRVRTDGKKRIRAES